MDSGDFKAGLVVMGIGAAIIGAIAGIVYVIVSVAKFAWES